MAENSSYFSIKILLTVYIFLSMFSKGFNIDFTFPNAITLKNGNIFIIHKNGVSICNSSYSEIIEEVYVFGNTEKISDEEDLSKVAIRQFEDGYILCAIINKIYIFDSNGQFKYRGMNIAGSYYTLAIDSIENKKIYYFLCGYISYEHAYLYYYKYDSTNKNINLVSSKTYPNFFDDYNNEINGLSCEFLKESTPYRIICMYSTYNYIYIVKLNITTKISIWGSREVVLKDIETNKIQMSSVKCIKSSVNPNKSKVLFCFYKNSGEAYCIVHDINSQTKTIEYDEYSRKCRPKYYSLKVNYLDENSEFVFSCITNQGGIQMITFEHNLSNIYYPTNKSYIYNNCSNIYGYSILYPIEYKQYYILSDINCSGISQFNEIIIDEEDNGEEKEKEKGKMIIEKEEYKEDVLDQREEERENINTKIKEKENEEEKEIEEQNVIFKEEEEEEEKKEEEEEEEVEEKKSGKKEKEIEEEKKEEKKEEEKEKEEKEEEKEEEKKSEKEEKEAEEENNSMNLEEKITEKKECEALEKCELCNSKCSSNNLCLKCNNKNGFFFLNKNIASLNLMNNDCIECVNDINKPSNFYFNKENQDYRPCYESCAECNYGGDGNENNCTVCESNYIMNRDFLNSTNCLIKCPYFYYYNSFGQYKCTKTLKCPEELNLLIKEKGRCIDLCKNDNIYIYEYNGQCFKECPEDTNHEENEYICKDININKCIMSEKDYYFLNGNVTDSEVEEIAKSFALEFEYTENHVSVFKNNIYTITIYKNAECISELSLQTPQIDFGNCYSKVKENYKIENNLIIAIISKKVDGVSYPKVISYSMHEPINGEKLLFNNICKDEKLVVQENLFTKLDNSSDINSILFLTGQNIDIFNLSSSFYNDICYHFDSPLEKDIALKDRIHLYFPNITLCEDDCQTKGVNLTSLKAICECKMSNIMNNNFLGNNYLYQSQIGELESMLSNTNIEVLKCYKDIFIYKYFIKNVGGFIILSLILIQIILTIIYYSKSLYLIRKYILCVTDKFLSYLSLHKNLFFSNKNSLALRENGPPKRRNSSKQNIIDIIKRSNSSKNNKPTDVEVIRRKNNRGKTKIEKIKVFNLETNKNYTEEKNNLNNQDMFNEKKDNFLIHNSKKNFKPSSFSRRSSKKNKTINIKRSNNNLNDEKFINSNEKLTKVGLNNPSLKIYLKNSLMVDLKDSFEINMDEYLKPDPDDMDYQDAIRNDKRQFCQYFVEKLKTNQIILRTFYSVDHLTPRSLRILLFILDIDLNLFVNGLFFNENYISQMFLVSENESIFSFIDRFMDRFFYLTLVNVILNYIIECFFIEEKKIIKTLKREKDNPIILKYEITQIIKEISTRYNSFIILSFIITFFTWYYVICFNNIYPTMKSEWIKTSLIIIISLNILSVLNCLLQSSLRFISFKFKSPKIYKVSQYLS